MRSIDRDAEMYLGFVFFIKTTFMLAKLQRRRQTLPLALRSMILVCVAAAVKKREARKREEANPKKTPGRVLFVRRPTYVHVGLATTTPHFKTGGYAQSTLVFAAAVLIATLELAVQPQ
jgi:hypothetical protein